MIMKFKMKRLCSALMLVVMLIPALGGVASSSTKAGASLSDPLEIQSWNVTLEGDQDFIVPTEAFFHIPEVLGITDMSWFESFDTNNGFVVLNPFELFTLWCYTEDADQLSALRAEYENKFINISYSDGIISLSCQNTPSEADVAPYGAEITASNSLTIERSNVFTAAGVSVTVTVETLQKWVGGSTVYVEVTDVSNSCKKSEAPFVKVFDRVTDMKIEQSTGSGINAYANVWVKTVASTFTFSERPAPFRFLWENGVYSGSITR